METSTRLKLASCCELPEFYRSIIIDTIQMQYLTVCLPGIQERKHYCQLWPDNGPLIFVNRGILEMPVVNNLLGFPWLQQGTRDSHFV